MACPEHVLEVPVEALDQAITLRVVGRGGDVLDPNGLTQGSPDGAAELWASVGGDGCWHAKPGDPGGDEGACAVISCSREQRSSLHPLCSAIYTSKKDIYNHLLRAMAQPSPRGHG